MFSANRTQWSRQININVPTHSGAHAQLCEWRSDLAYAIFLLKSARAFKRLLQLAEALNIADLYVSFQRIEQSTASFEDYDRVEHAWHQPTEWLKLLKVQTYLQILSSSVSQLSEGQKTKLALCRLFLQTEHYLLLDEPSNHLDTMQVVRG